MDRRHRRRQRKLGGRGGEARKRVEHRRTRARAAGLLRPARARRPRRGRRARAAGGGHCARAGSRRGRDPHQLTRTAPGASSLGRPALASSAWTRGPTSEMTVVWAERSDVRTGTAACEASRRKAAMPAGGPTNSAHSGSACAHQTRSRLRRPDLGAAPRRPAAGPARARAGRRARSNSSTSRSERTASPTCLRQTDSSAETEPSGRRRAAAARPPSRRPRGKGRRAAWHAKLVVYRAHVTPPDREVSPIPAGEP